MTEPAALASSSDPTAVPPARGPAARRDVRPNPGPRASYLPLLTVYFAYGALGLIDVTRDMWIKEQLRLSPAELATIGVWLSLPWTVKMVFGELVDSVPIFAARNAAAYILIGAGVHGRRPAASSRVGRRASDDLARPEQPLSSRRAADRDRHRDPGRRGGRRCRPRSWPGSTKPGTRAPSRTSAPSSAWCRFSAASRCRSAFLAVAGLSGWLAGFLDRSDRVPARR